MNASGPSWAELRKQVAGNISAEVALDLMVYSTYESFVRCVDRAIDFILRQMGKNPELRADEEEDRITVEIVTALRSMSLDAGHEAKVGGHCDIVVSGRNDYLWLGEAKKHGRGYAWIFQGFLQLSSRYSTGAPGQDSGAVLIYSDQPRVDQMMERWKEHLTSNQSGISFEDCTMNSQAFLSRHQHERTGRHFRVRHVPLSLYFDPKDKKPRKTGK